MNINSDSTRMEGLSSNLEVFIEKCDGQKMQAFLALVQKRFSEAQEQKRQRLEDLTSRMHTQLRELLGKRKSQLKHSVVSSLESLEIKRQEIASSLDAKLEAIRSKKKTMQEHFAERNQRIQIMEGMIGEMEREYEQKYKCLVNKHKNEIKTYFESVKKAMDQAQDECRRGVHYHTTERSKLHAMLLELLLACDISTETNR